MKIAIVCFDNFTDIGCFSTMGLYKSCTFSQGVVSDWDVQLRDGTIYYIYVWLAYSHDRRHI